MSNFDQSQHLLLRDVAHQRCIHQDGEYEDFVRRVREAGYQPFDVEIPDWPIVKRTPLPIIVFSIGGSGRSTMGGPTADMEWTGTQLAVKCDQSDTRTYEDHVTKRTLRDITEKMVPNDWMGIRGAWIKAPRRIMYAWQVEEFDLNKHVVIRYWCRRNNVNIGDFWLKFYPEVQDSLTIIKTTNPEIVEELIEGSYSPTRRSILRSQLYLLRNYFFGTHEEPSEVMVPVLVPQSRTVHDSEEFEEEQVRWDIHDGVQDYSPREVITALESTLGRDVRLFSGITLDSQIVAISREAMVRYLASNPVDKRQYILDSGGRNYDCDDFALTLRANLIRDHGYNCCAVIAGDVHAWNAFVVVGENGPEIVFIEPQTDGLVTELTGQYAVDNRCEALL